MEVAKSASVYDLLTDLCELHLRNSQRPVRKESVKKLRKRLYDILLHPRSHEHTDALWLTDCKDVRSQYMAWCYHLRQTGGFAKTARDIDDCLDRLDQMQHSPAHDEILRFLLRLRQMPAPHESATSSIPTAPCKYRVFKEAEFHLDKALTTCSHKLKFHTNLFQFRSLESRDEEDADNCRADVESEANCQLPAPRISWEHLHKTPFTARRTWEAYGNVSPPKEPPFISEAGAQVYSMMDKLSYSNPISRYERGVKDFFDVNTAEFKSHLKLIVVGMCSKTFVRVGKGLKLHPHVYYTEFSREALENYSVLPLKCGTIYNNITASMEQLRLSNQGFIVREFAKAIERYLFAYRLHLTTIPDKFSVHHFYDTLDKLSSHLFKVDVISNDSSMMANGVNIIDYLFRCIAAESDRSLVLLLQSILSPCLQLYFMKFLQPWVMDGHVDDEYAEFFVYAARTYVANRDRYYWTRAYLLRYDLVPQFLDAQWERIFDCGKTMNMLKLCVADSPICRYLREEKPTLLNCGVTSHQVAQLKSELRKYEMDMVVLRGNPFSIRTMMQMQHAQQLLFAKLALERRALTMRRLELEKVNKAKQQSELKRQEIERLRKDYEDAVAAKAKDRALALERELAEADALRKMREYEERLIQQEAKDIISHYVNLLQRAGELNTTFSDRCKDLDNIQLLDALNANDDREATDEQILDNTVVSETPSSSTLSDVLQRFNDDDEEEIDEIIQVVKTQRQLNKEKVLGSQIVFGDDQHFSTRAKKRSNHAPAMEEGDVENSTDTKPSDMSDRRSQLKLELEEGGEGALIDWKTSFNFELSSMTSSFATPSMEVRSAASSSSALSFDVDDKTVEHFQGQFFDQYLQQSLQDCIDIHYGFIRNEVLKHFVKQLNCIEYFECLHNLYFLVDGEYSRNLSESIFRRLYDSKDASRIIHVCTFNNIIQHALGAAFASFEHIEKVSFCIDNEPQQYDLCDVNALDGLSLMVDIKWPINIILPLTTLKKYDEIFTFLMKMNRVSWVLNQMWIEMKSFARNCGHYALCQLSTQFQKIHLFRHSMLHFVQTFQRYIAEDVLQSNWRELLETLNIVEDINDLYEVHTQYVKQINASCLLTKKSKPFQATVMKIFTVILKFYEYFRLPSWVLRYDEYRHEHFLKMLDLFYNFLELVAHFLKMGNKLAHSAYQPQLGQLIDLLDTNGFYSNTFDGDDFHVNFSQLILC